MNGAVPHRGDGGARRVGDGAAIARPTRPGRVPDLHRDPDTGVVVALDARLDDPEELRRALGLDPGRPPTQAGLAASAYLRWGEGFAAHLLGDFALLLWDPRSRRLLLARDPMAMRTLHYRVEAERVLVATEAKQILATPGVPDELDERMIASYLVGAVGAPEWSWFRGIRLVAPGHTVVVGGEGARTFRHWDIDPDRRVRHRSIEAYAEHLGDLFVRAMRARVPEEGRLGVFLSGGLDSGAAAGAAAVHLGEAAGHRIRAYSWDYGRFTECDERDRSRILARHFGFPAREMPVSDAGPLAGFPGHGPDPDDPFHGHFQLMLDRGFDAARADGVTALVTGMRGDLVAGPTDVGIGRLARERRWRELGDELRELVGIRGGPLPFVLSRGVAQVAGRLRAGRTGPGSGGPRIPDWVPDRFAARIGLEDLLRDRGESPSPGFDSPLRRRRYEWIFMPMHLRWATSQERRAAGWGLEAVDPWSDRRIAEFCVAVPQQVLDPRVEWDKGLVRRAMRGILPDRFRENARKTGPLPFYEHFLRHDARPTVRYLLQNSRADARGWLDAAKLLNAYEDAVSGGAMPGELWWALSLEWWLRLRDGTTEAIFPGTDAAEAASIPNE